MLFNSLQFLIFLPIVVAVYYLIPRPAKHLWLLAASYYFYMCWNAAYALLMLLSTAVTYLCGLGLDALGRRELPALKKLRLRRTVLWASLLINLAILFFFKYFNFAVDSLNALLIHAGLQLNRPSFDVLLPVGISFYTFQALGYTIDVYRGDIYAEKNFFRYALFVSFFPQLVAGPIERSKNLLKQLAVPKKCSYDNLREGLLLMLWGFFLKIVVADRLALFVDTVYGQDYQNFGGVIVIIATVFFAIQIYCDFGGYSSIAMGAAKMLGIDLMENFNTPYLSMSTAEFWRRWHISLSTWFREYVYIPLGGNRRGLKRQLLNIFIVWALTGLWHGASWNFVLWGLYYALWLTAEKVFLLRALEKLPSALRCLGVLLVVALGWMLFYFTDTGELFAFLARLFSFSAEDVYSRNMILAYLPTLALAVFAATPAGKSLYLRLREGRVKDALSILGLGAVFLLCTAALASQSYNPFIYFRF